MGEDYGMGMKAKYIRVATVAVPRLAREEGEPGDPPDPQKHHPDEEDLPALELEEDQEPAGLQNITVVEPLESRSQQDVTKVATCVFCRFRSMGVQALRFTQTENVASRTLQAFCRRIGLYRTMTGGDEGPSNGRIENEVQQVKRRLRLLMKESGDCTLCGRRTTSETVHGLGGPPPFLSCQLRHHRSGL